MPNARAACWNGRRISFPLPPPGTTSSRGPVKDSIRVAPVRDMRSAAWALVVEAALLGSRLLV